MALRVLHCPELVGGQAPGLARAEREVGAESICVALRPSPYGYEPDEVATADGGRAQLELARLRLLARAARDFDVVHFNFGRTILHPPAVSVRASRAARAYGRLASLRDMQLLRRLGKIIAVTFQGDDIRQGDEQRRLYSWSLAEAVPENYEPYGDAVKRDVVARFSRWAHVLYYLNPDLARVLPDRARFLAYASVDPRHWQPVPSSRRGPPLVLHAPSDPRVKGTAAIVAAVDELRARGVELEFRLVAGKSHAEARRLFVDADLYIDQLNAGWYGAAAVELMALGVPVACFIRQSDLAAVPAAMARELPIERVEHEGLADRLAALLAEGRAGLDARGAAARAFAERWHDPLQIAKETIGDYERARCRG